MHHNRYISYITSAALMLAIASAAEARDIAGLQAGALHAAGIPADETELTISGQMNAADFSYILDNLNNLQKLDLTGVSIVEYSGDRLPYTGQTHSAANRLPDYALTGLRSLQSIALPRSLQAVGLGSLSGTGIRSLSIPSAVTTIGDYAAMRCESLESLMIPANVSSIGTRAFAYCPKLSTVDIMASVATLPEGVFEACGGLTTLSLEALASCVEIGPWAVAECNGLATLLLPQGSEALQQGALYGTSGIEVLALPPTVSYLGDNAMTAMTGMKRLDVSEVHSVPELGENVWGQLDQSNITLTTPNDQTEGYRNAEQWKDFNIMSIDDWQSSTQSIASTLGAGKLTVSVSQSQISLSGGEDSIDNLAVFNAAGMRILSTKVGTHADIPTTGWARGIYLIVTDLGAAKIAI